MSEPKIIDCHTHLMWYPDHLSEQYAEEALASKLVKLKRSGGLAYSANLDKHVYDSKPEDHWRVSENVDKVVVFGLQANIGLPHSLGQLEPVRSPPGEGLHARRRFAETTPESMKNRVSADELWHFFCLSLVRTVFSLACERVK